MADGPVVHIGENSPEEVAYKLLRIIASNEGKAISFNSIVGHRADTDRQWLLDTYAECLRTVQNPHGRG